MSKYGSSTFLRTSAVYGSGQPTVFGETSSTQLLRKTAVDRSAVRDAYGSPSHWQTSYSIANSRTNSPQRSSSNVQSRTTSPSRPQAALTAASQPQRNLASPVRTSSRVQAPPNGLQSPARPKEYQYAITASGPNTPTSRTPERARSPNPITGLYSQYDQHVNNAQRSHQNQNQSQYYVGNGNASRTSSIGRGSSVGSVRSSAVGEPAAGMASERRNSFVGGKARAATPTKRSDSPFSRADNYGDEKQQKAAAATPSGVVRGNKAGATISSPSTTAQPQNNANSLQIGSDSPNSRANRTGSGVRRTASQFNQNQSSFHISACGPKTNPNESVNGSGSRRRDSPTRIDPFSMKAAGVSTRRERFDESPNRSNTVHRTQKDYYDKNFAGADAANLIFGEGSASAQASSVVRNSTPERTLLRRIDPPIHNERNGLWVRTKNKDDVLFLGVKGKGLPPPDGKIDETIVLSRKVFPQPQNIETAACRVVGEEQERTRAKAATLPAQPYHGFLIPPFRIDKSEILKARPDLEPETFMEPFGKGYTHRRHFDPHDSVKTDIQQGLAPTGDKGPIRGTAMVSGHGFHENTRNVLSLENYTAEALGEVPHRHKYMVGPPAFIPEDTKPFSQGYRAHRIGAWDSPTNKSQLDFGTSSHVQRAMESPVPTSTPRGPKTGTYSPVRNSTRPF